MSCFGMNTTPKSATLPRNIFSSPKKSESPSSRSSAGKRRAISPVSQGMIRFTRDKVVTPDVIEWVKQLQPSQKENVMRHPVLSAYLDQNKNVKESLMVPTPKQPESPSKRSLVKQPLSPAKPDQNQDKSEPNELVELEGILSRQIMTGKVPSWEMNEVSLSGQIMTFFVENREVATLDLAKCRAVSKARVDIDELIMPSHCLQLDFTNSPEPFYLCASTAEEFNEWMDAFNSVIPKH